MKLLALLDEPYYPHHLGGYVSRSPSAKFFRYLRPRVSDITLMVPSGKPVGDALANWAISTVEEGLQVIPLAEWRSQLEFAKKAPRLVRKLQRVMQAAVSRHDVVWIRMPSLAGVLLYREARRWRRPVLLHIVANELTAWRGESSQGLRILKRVFGLALHRVSTRMCRRAGVLASGRELFQLYESSSHVIANFVDSLVGRKEIAAIPAEARGVVGPGSSVTVLFVGRLVKSKGILELAQAVARLQGEGIRLRLKIIGHGRTSLVESVQRLVQPGSVDFVGYVPHGPRLFAEYRSAHVFVLPTPQGSEGLPRVILEAMACGVPVIATDIGGVGGLIAHGESGLLVRPGSVDELAEALRALATDAELRLRLARRALQQVWAYAAEVQADTVFRVLDMLERVDSGRAALVTKPANEGGWGH